MAITIDQQPSGIMPGYNNLVFVIDSDNKTEDNFKYICDIWYDGSLQQTVKLPARPVGGKAVFDAHRILENTITHDIGITDYGFKQNTNSYKDFFVYFGEEYDVSGTLTQYTNLAQSNIITAFNAAIHPHTWLDWDYTDYNLGSTTKKFLTNSGRIQQIHTGQSAWLHSFASASGIVSYAKILTYNSAGTLIDTYQVANSFNGSGFLRFGAGIIQLNNSTLSAGSQPVIDADVSEYTIQYFNVSNNAVSELMTYNIVDANCKYDDWRLHWLNTLGGYDSFSFDLKSRKTIDIDRKSYKKRLGSLSGSTWSYTRKDRSETDYNITSRETIKITSDWLTDEEMIWMEELLSSPDVYYEDSNNNLVAINMRDVSFEVKKKQNEKLQNLELTFTNSVANYRQRY